MSKLHAISGKQQALSGPRERSDALDPEGAVPLANAYRSGELIGERYRLQRLLGEGGMGVVWVARNVALDAEVAIKMLRAGEKKSEGLERRMLKEAQAVARLGHPAILRVFDFGTTRLGDPYMVMELLDGEDLGHTLERNGRLTPIKAVRTLLPILHALGTAHLKGIIHRDLKPENIFLARTDGGYVQPKLVDFGIVKTEAPDADRLTHLGTVLGTPAYLCPEQARGEDVDQRADVWSAAVVLYEMVTCRLPFGGSNYNALMRSIIEDAPPPITSFGTGDAELWAIIERGLAKRAAERWPSMSAFGSALAHWLLERGESNDISGAALRVAWQHGPAVADPNDLYSGRPRPCAPAGSSAAPHLDRGAPQQASGHARGFAVTPRTSRAPRAMAGRRYWKLAVVTAAAFLAAFQLSSAVEKRWADSPSSSADRPRDSSHLAGSAAASRPVVLPALEVPPASTKESTAAKQEADADEPRAERHPAVSSSAPSVRQEPAAQPTSRPSPRRKPTPASPSQPVRSTRPARNASEDLKTTL